ncbi:MAG TPA: radical SAM protein [bacterium]|nr:radical SAM protein [bacterium]
MKVLLINPPSEHMITTNIPSVIDEERGYNPPLGLLYVAGYAKAKTAHEIRVLDCQVEETTHADVEKRIREFMPDVVGIQTLTFTLIDARMVAQAAKRANPACRVVLGGPHVHIFARETLMIPEVDFAIKGEGELAFTQLLSALEGLLSYDKVFGLAYRDAQTGAVKDNPPAPPVEDLDSLPYPARELTPMHKYYSLIARHNPITTMFTSRGCPYRCLFCDRPTMGRRFRSHSALAVVNEMEACVKLGIREFFIYDDTFNVNRKRVFEICDEIKKRKLGIAFDIRARADRMDEEMLKELASAGCDRIHYGVESGNAEVLETLMKDLDLDHARKIFKATRKYGMKTLAYFMIGNPGETREMALKTIEFAKELDPDFVHFSVLTPFPATAIYYKALEEGRFDHDYWADFAKNPTPDFKPRLWEEHMNREELIELLKFAYKSFYLRPKIVMKNMSYTHTPLDFFRKARAGLKMIRI